MMLMDIDPNLVKPGWTPLIITIILAGIMVLLFISMRRQFRKINVPGDDVASEELASNDEPAAAPPVLRD